MKTASRVLHNKPNTEHGFDRLVAAAAILIGSCKGWSDPKDRRVIEMADRIAAVERDGIPPARVTAEQRSEGDRVWYHTRRQLAAEATRSAKLQLVWLEQIRALGLVDGTLWLTGDQNAVTWVGRRWTRRLTELLDVKVMIVNEGRAR